MTNPKFFSCVLDDFQDYIYEGFGTILNKSRSANVGVVFSHQSLGDLEQVSPAFKNIVLTNTNIKIVMKMSDPDTGEHFARTFGTKTVTKITEKVGEDGKTGDGTVRDAEKFIFNPNIFKNLGVGRGVISVPHEGGVKLIEMKFDYLKNLRRHDLPERKKTPRKRTFPGDLKKVEPPPQAVLKKSPSKPTES